VNQPSLAQLFIFNHIEVGTHKVIIDLTKDNLTIGVVRQIIAAAMHAMQDNDLSEIIIKTSGYSEHRDRILKSYDFYRYGGQTAYRLVNPAHEDRIF
jgi:hypothetical protein